MATVKGTQKLYAEALEIFQSNIKKRILTLVDNHLGSDEVLNEFDTNRVYDIMDEKYIGCTDSYEDSIAYIENPFEKFKAYTEEIG